MQALEAANLAPTAVKVKSLLSQIFRYAEIREIIAVSPMYALRGVLKAPIERNFSAIKCPKRLGKALLAIDQYENPITRCALQLIALTFVRPGELRNAEWSEIDWENSCWVIPAHRMKKSGNGDLIVPLSTQACRILSELRPYTGQYQYLFTTGKKHQGNIQPISDGTLNRALVKCGIERTDHVVHGFRQTASTLLHESGKYSSDWVEQQLHHKLLGVKGKYNKATHIVGRTLMMQDYANMLDGFRTEAKD